MPINPTIPIRVTRLQTSRLLNPSSFQSARQSLWVQKPSYVLPSYTGVAPPPDTVTADEHYTADSMFISADGYAPDLLLIETTADSVAFTADMTTVTVDAGGNQHVVITADASTHTTDTTIITADSGGTPLPSHPRTDTTAYSADTIKLRGDNA